MYLSMKLTKPEYEIEGMPLETQTILPKGCVGILHVWESVEAGKDWLGDDTQFAEIDAITEAKKGKEQ